MSIKKYYSIAKTKLFPLTRSLTGSGVKKTLNILKKEIPQLKIKKFYGNNFKNKLFGISKKNVNNWRSRITNQEKNIIEFYLNDVMRIYGYKCSKNLKKLNHDFSFFNDKINSKYFYADRFKK